MIGGSLQAMISSADGSRNLDSCNALFVEIEIKGKYSTASISMQLICICVNGDLLLLLS